MKTSWKMRKKKRMEQMNICKVVTVIEKKKERKREGKMRHEK